MIDSPRSLTGAHSPRVSQYACETPVFAAAPSGDEPQHVDRLLSGRSSNILRTASTTFTGGAALIPPDQIGTGESEFIASASAEDLAQERRPSRTVHREHVQQRMMEELMSRFRIRITVFFVTFAIYSIIMTCLALAAVWAVIVDSRQPCDVPLKYYLILSVSVAQAKMSILKPIQRRPWARTPHATVMISMLGSVPSLFVMSWGVRMVRSCVTCSTTNPGLYYATRNFIYGQIIYFFLTNIFFSVGYTFVLTRLSTFKDLNRRGCEKAVHRLQKVPNDSQDLVDPEDGIVMDCPICAESLGDQDPVVRTPCLHHFHEHCLARWCKNHVDCPLCREQVGESESSTDDTSTTSLI